MTIFYLLKGDYSHISENLNPEALNPETPKP